MPCMGPEKQWQIQDIISSQLTEEVIICSVITKHIVCVVAVVVMLPCCVYTTCKPKLTSH